MYKDIRIVMVNTSHPGNIGAAARSMKAMNLDELYLVNPKIFPHAEITARAAGADDLIAKARVVTNIEEALLGCRLVLGCSARLRFLSLPLLNPRKCAEETLKMAEHSPVAILFGNEQHGLSNRELEHCHFQVHIPTNSEFSSLNVAAAIQIITYELNTLAQENTSLPSNNKINNLDLPATSQELELFYTHLEQTLINIKFLDPSNPRKLMQRLHRFFNRAQPEAIELNILRGILAAAESFRKKYN